MSQDAKQNSEASRTRWEDVEKPSYDVAALQEQFRRWLYRESPQPELRRNGTKKRAGRSTRRA